MRTLREWMVRLIGTVIGRRSDRDLEQELQSHLELAEEEARRRGESPQQAAREARIRFGGVAQGMDAYRERRGWPWMEDLVYDIRHAVRALRRAPGFTAVAVITLALGIGANTAIFSIVDGVLLRPFAYPRPEQLMYLSTDGGAPFPVSVPEYLEFRQFATTFAGVGAFRLGEANLSAGDQPRRVRTASVDASLMKVLAVQPIDGRLFAEADTVVTDPPLPGASAVTVPLALVSYGLWQSAFGGRPLVGSTIDVDGRRLQVIGVMPRGVDLMDDRTDVWLPLGFTGAERQARNNHNLELIGRLKADVTVAAAHTELDVLIQNWRARTGITPGPGQAGHVFAPSGSARHVLLMTPLADQVLGRASRSIWVLQAAVALVLFIACANVANLLLARAETRRRDVAVLKALGASRGRLLRNAVVESVTLAIAGSALGIVLARAGVDALTRLFPLSLPRIGEVAIDVRVMLASLAVAVACGLVCGLAPLIHTRSDAIAERLKSTARGSTSTPGRRVRGALVSVETGLAVIVAIGAGLLLKTVHNLTAVDAGFDRSRLVTFSLRLPSASFDNLGRVRAYQRILEAVRGVPGVHSASGMTGLPLDRPTVVSQTEIADSVHPMARTAPLVYQRVLSDFVETIGLPIVQGRAFNATDAASSGGVAIVNETLAKVYWQGQNPVGQRLRRGGTAPWLTVIGVARDVKQAGVDQPVYPEIYVLIDQLATDTPTSALSISPTALHVVLRTTLPLGSLAPALTRAIGEINRQVPLAQLREMDEVFTDSIRRPRLLAQVLTVFAGLALVLAAIGTYGVLSYMVAERRREVGIRLALGAGRRRVLWQIMRYGLTLAGCGLIVGVAAALGVTRLVAALLFEVEPADPATLIAVFTLLAAVAVFACWLPAWRASRLDPNAVLRIE